MHKNLCKELFYKFLEIGEIYLFPGLGEIVEGEFLEFRSMRYTAVFDDRYFKVPVVGVLDEASHAQIRQNSADDDVLDTIQFFFQWRIIERTDLVLDDDGVRVLYLDFGDELGFRSEEIQWIRLPMFGENDLVASRPAMIDQIIHFAYHFLHIADIIFAFRIRPFRLEVDKH